MMPKPLTHLPQQSTEWPVSAPDDVTAPTVRTLARVIGRALYVIRRDRIDSLGHMLGLDRVEVGAIVWDRLRIEMPETPDDGVFKIYGVAVDFEPDMPAREWRLIDTNSEIIRHGAFASL